MSSGWCYPRASLELMMESDIAKNLPSNQDSQMLKESVRMKNHVFLRVSEVKLGLPRWLNGDKKKKKKNPLASAGDTGSIPGSGRSFGAGNGNPFPVIMATQYSSILAWRIPWTEESGRLQSMVLQRVRLD